MSIPDQSVGRLIELARDRSAAMAERHHAFEEIVRRFQELAFACARARLHDPALAEDAAQDAFLLTVTSRASSCGRSSIRVPRSRR